MPRIKHTEALPDDVLTEEDIGVTVSSEDHDHGDTYAALDHDHDGDYEPLDPTILRNPDIGDTVQGHADDLDALGAATGRGWVYRETISGPLYVTTGQIGDRGFAFTTSSGAPAVRDISGGAGIEIDGETSSLDDLVIETDEDTQAAVAEHQRWLEYQPPGPTNFNTSSTSFVTSNHELKDIPPGDYSADILIGVNGGSEGAEVRLSISSGAERFVAGSEASADDTFFFGPGVRYLRVGGYLWVGGSGGQTLQVEIRSIDGSQVSLMFSSNYRIRRLF